MKRGFKAAVGAALIFAAAAIPASAAIIVNSANSGYNFVIDYAGRVGGSSTDLVSALANFTFTGVSNGGLTYNFDYSLTNDSIVDSRLSSFGFNLTSNIASGSATGTYSYLEQNVNYPESIGNIEVCLTATDNGTCTGNGAGLTSNPDQTGTGTFALTFANVMEAVSFDDFAVRFQSINPTINGSSSGVGIGALVGNDGPVSVAPDPSTWMLLLGGFGLVGVAMRRRREGDLIASRQLV